MIRTEGNGGTASSDGIGRLGEDGVDDEYGVWRSLR